MASSSKHQSHKAAKRLRAIDLFSGCGGLTLGLKRAGFDVVGAVESDDLSVKSYRLNHPETTVWQSDIRKVAVRKVMRRLRLTPGRLDLLAGCPPCQGFSALPRLNGGRRVRNPRQKNLVFEFVRFVRVLQPKFVMMENVPGLVKDRRMRRLLREMRRLGYKCEWRILNAAHYGVPQRRHRLILLGGRSVLPAFALPSPSRPSVRQAIGSLPRAGASGDPLHDLPEARSRKVRELIRRIPKNGGSRLDLGRRKQLGCHKRCDGFSDVYGRMAWADVSPTITSGFVNPSKGRFLHPSCNRAITLREGAMLQSFPRRYEICLTEGKYRAAELIGNALPPTLIRRLAGPVVTQLRTRSSNKSRPRNA
jgi:DNA (cytosine-5)-methyltransferase 1